MARNQAQDYATMDDDERRKFAGEVPAADDAVAELDFDDPRNEANQGHSQVPREAEAEDTEHRDGSAAQLDEAAHDAGARRRRS